MIYYVTGLNSRNVKIEEIMKEFTNIKIHDGYIKEEYENFIEDISNTSLFAEKELIILKRAEKVKQMKDLINFLKNFKDENKTIIIDYYAEYKNKNTYLKDFEKMNANIINIEDDSILIDDYISKNLKISDSNKKKLLEMIGVNYNHVKNEIYKYNTILKNEEFSFEKVKGLINISEEQKIYNIVDKIMYDKIEFDSIPSNLYIGIIYGIYKECEILHKLYKLNLSIDYNKFKSEYEKYKELFNMHFYRVYLKNKNLNKYTSNKCFKILLECNKNEMLIKQGILDEKTAFFNVFQLIFKVRKN